MQEAQKGEKGVERIFEETIVENVPSLVTDLNIHMSKAQETARLTQTYAKALKSNTQKAK